MSECSDACMPLKLEESKAFLSTSKKVNKEGRDMKHERSNMRLERTHPTCHQKAWRKAVRVKEATGVFY